MAKKTGFQKVLGRQSFTVIEKSAKLAEKRIVVTVLNFSSKN